MVNCPFPVVMLVIGVVIVLVNAYAIVKVWWTATQRGK